MSNTYTEVIEQLEAYPLVDGETDVVCTIHWRLNATDGQFSATAYGSVGLTWADGDPFTPYTDLTKEQVWGWVASKVNMTEIQTNLDQQIADQVNPKIVFPPLPFQN